MGVEQLFTGSRWQILEALAKEPKSTTELAKQLQTSNANISQQLKQLELANVIQRRRAPEKKHVHYVYEIPTNYAYLIQLSPGYANKNTLTQTAKQQLLTKLLLHKHATALLTFVLCLPNYFDKSLAIGVLERPKPELFILTEHVDEFRTNSNVELDTLDGKTTVAIWSHSEKEVQEGLKKNDQYFYKSLQETSIVYDPHKQLRKLKQEAEQTNE